MSQIKSKKEDILPILRDVFQAKYGKGDEQISLFKEFQSAWADTFDLRFISDTSGPFFTVVTEDEVESFAEWEKRLESLFAHPDFGSFFERMEPLVDSGSREFYRIE